ncbi:ABC transporter ATP-binding protein [Rhodococcus aerolatus]
MTDLVLTDVRKAFGGPPVLDGVDLTVPSGSLTAVLGPSGCGKTTLLRLVAGFDAPDAGTVTLGGRTVAGAGRAVPPQRRRVGYVAQEGALFPHLDVAANITFGLPRAQRGRGARTTELMALVGLEPDLAGRLPSELSGGQQQRVALARALGPRPELVLLDEPFSALDAGLRGQTRAAVAAALRAAGATAVLVTHDQDEALSMADQLAVLRDGVVAQVGEPRAVYQAPVDAFCATFVGDAMLLPCTVAGRRARTDMLGELDVAGPVPAGDALVVLRPEHLEVLPAGAGTGPGSEIAARVTAVDFYGHDAVVHLVVGGTGDAAGTTLRARARAGPLPATGDVVGVRVDAPVSCVPA